MDKINTSSTNTGAMTPTAEQATEGSGDRALAGGLAHADNQSLRFSPGSVSGATTSARAGHDDAAVPRGHRAPGVPGAPKAAASLGKADKEQINLATRQAAGRSASSSTGAVYPALDMGYDNKIINDIMGLTIKKDLPLEEEEAYFRENIAIVLPYRPEGGFSFHNLTVSINQKMTESAALKKIKVSVLTKYLFSSVQPDQHSEKIIIPSGYFKTEETAGIVLHNILEAANDSIYAQKYRQEHDKNDMTKCHARKQTIAVAWGVHRLIDFLKNENHPEFQIADIDNIIGNFPELIHLGQTIRK